jgi:hypothetical protein
MSADTTHANGEQDVINTDPINCNYPKKLPTTVIILFGPIEGRENER